jgi:transcription elongation factor
LRKLAAPWLISCLLIYRPSVAVAHYIAGVLDRESMVEMIETLAQSSEFKPGDRVKTLRGTTHGVVVRCLPDGRVVWQPSGSQSELMALPESLVKKTAEKPAATKVAKSKTAN